MSMRGQIQLGALQANILTLTSWISHLCVLWRQPWHFSVLFSHQQAVPSLRQSGFNEQVNAGKANIYMVQQTQH